MFSFSADDTALHLGGLIPIVDGVVRLFRGEVDMPLLVALLLLKFLFLYSLENVCTKSVFTV